MSKQTAMTLFVNDTLRGEVKEVSYYLEMEKQQQARAWHDGLENWDSEWSFEQYYNETFNK